MKNKFIIQFAQSILFVSSLLMANLVLAQTDKEKKVIVDCDTAKAEFLRTDEHMQNLFSNAFGYAIFPNVGKGAVGVGGASGNGVVYEHGKIVGKAKMSQVTVGFQVGGQAYREIIFFETREALDKFKKNNLDFSAQVSAVAVKKGASANANYKDGVMVYTQQKGGLMYEASVGGQKFKYSTF